MNPKLFAVLLIVLPCAFVPTVQGAEAPKENAAAVDSGYRIQPGDVLQVSVWKEKDLEREVLVRPDGALSFPLAGDIQATDKTVEQLRRELGQKIGKYIPDPVVTVAVKAATGYKIYVVGRVARPGEYVTTRYVDVVQALSLAGGVTPFASANSIKILRRKDSVVYAIPFKYGRIESGRSLEQNIMLQSGDTVLVP
jgi:polysaccharide export outer membrane protein